MQKFNPPIFVSLLAMDEKQLRGLYAVLASPTALAAVLAVVDYASDEPVYPELASASPASGFIGAIATNAASPSDGAVDAHGHPWSAVMHASTQTMTKEGLWRMKVGVTRPEPLPGFPKADAEGNGAPGTDSSGTVSTEAVIPQADTARIPDAGSSDEFAAFTKANAQAAAAVEVPARSWTDADLSSLCAQAATKLGNADPVRAVIAAYTPEGETPHSRNVPADQREAFAAEIEKAAQITYAG